MRDEAEEADEPSSTKNTDGPSKPLWEACEGRSRWEQVKILEEAVENADRAVAKNETVLRKFPQVSSTAALLNEIS